MQEIACFRIACIPPGLTDGPIRCPDCNSRWFDSVDLTGRMIQKCRSCKNIWILVIFGSDAEFAEYAREFVDSVPVC